MMMQEEKIQVILKGKTITGTRTFIKDVGKLRLVVEYRGYQLEETCQFRCNFNRDAMLWEARRLLVQLIEMNQMNTDNDVHSSPGKISA
jgi:hypothetical protein